MAILTSGTFVERELTNASKWFLRVTQAASAFVTGVLGDDDWIVVSSFLNGWSNVGGSEPSVAYRVRDGILMLRGGVTRASVNNTAAFNLPSAYRPADEHMFLARCGTGIARVDVNAAGDVIPVAVGGGGTIPVALDGICLPLG